MKTYKVTIDNFQVLTELTEEEVNALKGDDGITVEEI